MKIRLLLLGCICCHLAYSQIPDKELDQRQEKILKWKREQKKFTVPESISRKQFATQNGITAPLATDQDGDGLTDAEEAILKTNPLKPDTDEDGLYDSWEVGRPNGIDLKAMGASPLHKDIFVEMDYMVRTNAANGLGPDQAVLLAIEEAFINAPVTNPDGKPGINLHLVAGNEVPYDDNLEPLFDEFAAIKRAHFDARRAPIFHYMIWANAYEGSTSSGYSFDIPHSDFIVTLGAWNNNQGGLAAEKIGTFLHELGHNLGLAHGGSEHMNYKPNHLSVMNYHFQMSGVPKMQANQLGYYHSYQPFALAALNEASLIEADGVGKAPGLKGYYTRFFSAAGIATAPADTAIDWNTNGVYTDHVLNMDLNNDGLQTQLQATPNEWERLHFKGGLIGDLSALQGLMSKSIQQFKRFPFKELEESRQREWQQKLMR